jgi:hypothetical protein
VRLTQAARQIGDYAARDLRVRVECVVEDCLAQPQQPDRAERDNGGRSRPSVEDSKLAHHASDAHVHAAVRADHLYLAVLDHEQPVLDGASLHDDAADRVCDLLEHAGDSGQHVIRGAREQFHAPEQRDPFDRERHVIERSGSEVREARGGRASGACRRAGRRSGGRA